MEMCTGGDCCPDVREQPIAVPYELAQSWLQQPCCRA